MMSNTGDMKNAGASMAATTHLARGNAGPTVGSLPGAGHRGTPALQTADRSDHGSFFNDSGARHYVHEDSATHMVTHEDVE